MRNLSNELKNKTIDYNKLLKYGFKKKESKYILKTKIHNEQFEIIINISEKEKTSKLIDLSNEDEYILVNIEGTTGEFVGKIREEYERKLQEIIEQCTFKEVFKSKQSKEIIKYIKEKYNDDLEFLWEKYDETAIWRNKASDKWYGLILKISKSKLGIDSEEVVEIIDLHYQKDKVEEVIDNKSIFAGYHMNKHSWITIVLDGKIDMKKVFTLIDNSYNLSKENKLRKIGT